MDIKQIIVKIEEKKRENYIGRKYYFYKPKNKASDINTYQNGEVHTFKQDNTNEVYTNWFKVLVNQKIDYSLVKPVTIDSNIPDEFYIDDIVSKLALNASLDSKSWLHIYINNSKRLDWIVVNDNQIIDVWDDYNKYITIVIRFWIHAEDRQKRESEQITHVEMWTADELITFDYKNDNSKEAFNIEKKSHYLEKLKYQDEEIEINPKGFGFIPFLPLFNNKNIESDIDGIQVLLDAYNEIGTGFINNVRKFQEMLMKLRGYGGQELKGFMDELIKNKVVVLDEGGDLDYIKVDIPVEARNVLLEICRKNIFTLGRGVDPTDDMGGSNITNVLIKSKYSNLDMKNSEMEKQIRLFYKQLITMLNTYYNINLDDNIIFNRSQIFNETETIDNCIKSMGLVSIETILNNHPWVDDPQGEIELLKKEQENEIIKNDKENNKTEGMI